MCCGFFYLSQKKKGIEKKKKIKKKIENKKQKNCTDEKKN